MIPAPSAPRIPQGKCLTVGGRADGGVLQYAQLLNPRNSMSITNTKGLLNMPGQNNCFLNSAVQVLWHLDIFRRSFRELCGHACMEDSCIFCALKELFAQFQYSQESALPPDALRRALAETFCDQRRFQLGFMDDAAECFENILMRIHFHIANSESEDMCSALHCIPHQKFAMTLVEQTVCHACGATSEPLPFTQMVHYVPSSALCSQAKLMKDKTDQIPSFSELLKRAGGLGDFRDCPSSCGTVIQIRKTLMNRPEIVSIGLVWDSERPTIDHIMDVFKTIGMSLKLQDVFHSVVDSRWASTATHQLVGIVTYYGKHYSTFFFHTKLRVWIYFDDAAVREIGPKWEQVVEKCCRGHFQPLLLLYANPLGTPVDTSTAPRIIKVVPGHKKNLTGKESSDLNMSHEKSIRFFQPGNQRRAVTPNPEMSCDLSANLQPRRAVTPSGELSWGENSRKEQNVELKENIPLNTSGDMQDVCSKPTPYSKNHSDVIQSKPNAPIMDNPALVKTKLPMRMSVPNCTFYSDIYQSKPNKNIGNSLLNRPASVDDILQSTTNQVSKEANSIKIDSNLSEDNSAADTSNVEEVCSDNTYISRKAVENVLQLQKLQRQRSMNCKNGHIFVGQRNSSSSLESLDNVFREKNYGGAFNVKDIPDAMNMARRRDSGNWSGDRNSASSSSTTSLDNPYFYVIGNKRLPNSTRNIGRNGEVTLADPGYDSFSLSSSDSYPSIINSSPGKIDSRLGQIPENVQTAFVPYDLSQLQYCLKELKNNEHFPFGFKDECDKLCAEADIFVAKSVERENVGDISMAALLSDTAAAKARAAMDVPYTNSQALAMAKMKHSMCLIRSSNLHKKLKEAEVAMRRKQREALLEINRNTHPKASNKSATDSQNKCNSDNSCEKNSKEQKQISSNQESNHSSSDKNIEIYATLPKRSLKKKGALSSFVESLTGDESSDERSIKEKKNKSEENIYDIGSQKVNPGNGTSNKDDKVSKSPCNKKKSVPSYKSVGKDSDLSDYSSEWEQAKKQSLCRTYSGPTSNSKSELSDLNLNNNQSFVDQPSKKQHKIRRKLMGGFMKRKNRSLPDLREGQDSGGELPRSFDDCFFAQTPIPCRKKQDNRNSSFPDIENGSNSQCEKEASPPAQKLQDNSRISKKSIVRTHTPPPYKPPPPITHSNQCNISPKRITQSSDSSPKFELPHSIFVTKCSTISPHKSNNKQRTGHQLPLSRGPKDHRKVNFQYVLHNHDDLHPASAVWLKELQLKQVEINQKRKLQEERQRWLSECKSGADEKLICSSKNSESPKDDFSKTHIISMMNKENTVQNESKYCNNQNSPPSSEQKSVRDLASRFEKSTVPTNSEVSSGEKDNVLNSTAPGDTFTANSIASENGTYIHSASNVQYLPQSKELDQSKLHSALDQHSASKVEKPLTKPTDSPTPSSGKGNKDRLNGVHNAIKQPYTSQSTSGCVYNPHLTDAQLTNVLRIGTNRSSFRNTNSNFEAQDDNFSQYSRDAYVLPEAKRPDKPPDYETAIQRLELLRNDRNFARYYSNNCMSFEALLEQAKRRRGPKKSVTFSDKVVLVACAGDEDNDFIPNPLLERVYKQHLMKPNLDNQQLSKNESKLNFCNESNSETCTSQDSSHSELTKSTNQTPCHLCHKKMVVSPNLYCPDCAYYMSRFQQK